MGKDKQPWWANSKFELILTGYYECHCPACDIDFFVCEDWPYHIQQLEDKRPIDEATRLPTGSPNLKNLEGLTVFEIHCPRCGQKLMFSTDDTPWGKLEWHKLSE